ncbi:TadE/TadG family type IV pilus assembly protein [Paraburkholderia ferrariae]|uniref:TadE/TadG family type IV pilus assembly protein n=1 Tax=Paraburkholderia ferrariae TaxID=386056 RepID=UPI0009FF8DD7|nr:TadE/TadG family type IV pilus assembly protein [Paraburkholderia ferrariae]
MKRVRRFRARGAAAVEMAFVLPLLVLVVLGIVYFGWLFNNYVVMVQSAAAGAHTLATERGFSTPCSDAQTAIQQVGTQAGTGTPLSGALSTSVLCGKASGLIAAIFTVGGTTCTSDSACVTALGSSTVTPAAGTMATVTLTYRFGAPFTDTSYGNSSFLARTLTVSMSELVQ